MPAGRRSPPPGAARAAAIIAIAVAAAIIVIFLGLNFWHADTLREQQSGKVDAVDAPKSPNDLQRDPLPPR